MSLQLWLLMQFLILIKHLMRQFPHTMHNLTPERVLMSIEIAEKGHAMRAPSRLKSKKSSAPPDAAENSMSRFMRRTLMQGETVILEGYFHTIYTFTCLLTLLFCIGAGWGGQYCIENYLHQKTVMPMGVGLVVGLWLFFSMLLKKWTTEIVLTSERLIYKRGFFMIRSQEVDIEQLASDNVEQSFIGRLFDYGTLHIRCIEASDFWLPPIRAPYAFRNALEQQKHLYRDNYMKIERLRRHGNGTEAP